MLGFSKLGIQRRKHHFTSPRNPNLNLGAENSEDINAIQAAQASEATRLPGVKELLAEVPHPGSSLDASKVVEESPGQPQSPAQIPVRVQSQALVLYGKPRRRTEYQILLDEWRELGFFRRRRYGAVLSDYGSQLNEDGVRRSRRIAERRLLTHV